MNAVRFTDEFIRDLFEELNERNLLDDTIFIVLGDHGEAFAEHGQRGHNNILWEEALRTVGLIYSPKYFPGGGTISGYRSILDIVPTVSALAGMRVVRGEFLGLSLLDGVPDDRELFFSGWSKHSVLGDEAGAGENHLLAVQEQDRILCQPYRPRRSPESGRWALTQARRRGGHETEIGPLGATCCSLYFLSR